MDYVIMINRGDGWKSFNSEIYEGPVGHGTATTIVNFLNVAKIFKHKVVKI